MIDETQLAAYRAAREAAAFADISDWGWVRLAGRDRLDLLHRLSTNDLKRLPPGHGALTVFTNATARVMAVLTVYAGESDVYLRTMPGQGAGVTRYLNSMIFWQDRVEVADLTSATSQFALYGPGAAAVLESLVTQDLDTIAAYGWRAVEIAGQRALVFRGGPLEVPAWFLAAAPDAPPAILEALAPAAVPIDAATADILRIEAGLPLWGRELIEQVTPLETGLLGAIDFNKGCYTGQEIIARQTNYDKVTRNLVGLEFELSPDSPLLAEGGAGGEVWAQVRGPGRGGFVGSVAYSPALDRVIGLAVVPRELAQPGAEVEVTRADQTLKATVRGLPFVQ
ncbi:MAG: glycine cleavage T C-terminal barrel domain-containing protein [Nitrososphaerales archaeon]